MNRTVWLVLFACLVARAPWARADDTGGKLTYEQHVRPILKANCFRCHGGEGETKGDLDLRLRRLIAAGGESGPAIVPGNRQESLLYQRVRAGEMPPTDRKLTPAEVALIGDWIDAGAATAREEPETLDPGLAITPEERAFWSFQPIPKSVPIPSFTSSDRLRTPIDAFLAGTLREKGLAFSPDAPRAVLLRRAYFDLIGLPPSREELAHFLADTDPQAYERAIDRLLDSPHYGERWGRYWLDVAGYADSDGYAADDTVRPFAYKYRDYVVRALGADKPLDEFITEQLAGDELTDGDPAHLTPEKIDKLSATGFLRMAADGTATGGIDQDLARNQVMADTIKIVATSLLGLSVGCAQCHDHRYDPIPQADYYRLRAVFEPAYDWKKWRTPPERLVSLWTDADRAKAAEVDAEAAKVRGERAAKEAAYMEEALEQELAKYDEELQGALRLAYKTPDDKRTPEQKRLLELNPSVNISPGVLYQYIPKAAEELKKIDAQIAAIMAKTPFQDFVPVLNEVPGNLPATLLFHRGDHRQPAEEIAPGGLTVCAPPGERLEIAPDDRGLPTSGRRLALARWITGPQNPLTARVLANRVWMHHFGRGLVNTPADFGTTGEAPTHPELLDWLARDLVEGGWKLKRLHKLIMTSTAYRQSSARDERNAAIDPDDRLYWRMPVRRLDAETLRDRILATSGVVNLKMFGPPVPVKEDAVGQIVVGVDAPAAGSEVPPGHEAFRRGLYVQVRRSQPLAMLHVFDQPVMETNCERRVVSTVATQSLLLMNSDFILGQAGYFAARIRKEAAGDPGRQVQTAWQLAFGRAPDARELERALAFLAAQTSPAPPPAPAVAAGAEKPPAAPSAADLKTVDPLVNLCQVLLSTNEFLYVE
ncbi:MAG: PSD1 and planctomycete cytochrome C domain-containing protein [Pirellulales bacterium]